MSSKLGLGMLQHGGGARASAASTDCSSPWKCDLPPPSGRLTPPRQVDCIHVAQLAEQRVEAPELEAAGVEACGCSAAARGQRLCDATGCATGCAAQPAGSLAPRPPLTMQQDKGWAVGGGRLGPHKGCIREAQARHIERHPPHRCHHGPRRRLLNLSRKLGWDKVWDALGRCRRSCSAAPRAAGALPPPGSSGGGAGSATGEGPGAGGACHSTCSGHGCCCRRHGWAGQASHQAGAGLSEPAELWGPDGDVGGFWQSPAMRGTARQRDWEPSPPCIADTQAVSNISGSQAPIATRSIPSCSSGARPQGQQLSQPPMAR